MDELANLSGVSKASLSRLENGDVSPTAIVLGKLCAAYEITLSRLMMQIEDGFTPLVPTEAQPVWTDRQTGFTRRSVSPPTAALSCEVLECSLKAGSRIHYANPPRPGLEHHLILKSGQLDLQIEGELHQLCPGDCLRYRLFGASTFSNTADEPAVYLLVIS